MPNDVPARANTGPARANTGPALPADELREVLREVRRIDLQTRRLVDEVMTGSYLSVFRGRGIEFESVREYVEGDDPRAVDWNVTARMGRPYVKTYVDERELPVVFVVDHSLSMDGGMGVWSARQMAARLVACLGASAVRNGDKTALVTFGKHVDEYVRPKKGTAHLLRIVRDCLAVPAGPGTSDMGTAIRFAAGSLRRRAILFVISDFLSDGWSRAMSVCSRRHDVIAVRVQAPELVLPSAGLWRVRDPESGQTRVIDTSSARVRAAYASRIKAWSEHTERELRKAGVDRMDVPLPTVRHPHAVAGPILRFFRMRQLRGARS